LQQCTRAAFISGLHLNPADALHQGPLRFTVPLHREPLLRERELDQRRHRIGGYRKALHRGDLAVDPRSEALHEVAHGAGADADRHHDLHASADMHARREPSRTRADSDGEWIAGAASLEQR